MVGGGGVGGQPAHRTSMYHTLVHTFVTRVDLKRMITPLFSTFFYFFFRTFGHVVLVSVLFFFWWPSGTLCTCAAVQVGFLVPSSESRWFANCKASCVRVGYDHGHHGVTVILLLLLLRRPRRRPRRVSAPPPLARVYVRDGRLPCLCASLACALSAKRIASHRSDACPCQVLVVVAATPDDDLDSRF